jgi:hypothetical protein
MWWIQNSYGHYASLPLLREPFVRFIENSNEMWFERWATASAAAAVHH